MIEILATDGAGDFVLVDIVAVVLAAGVFLRVKAVGHDLNIGNGDILRQSNIERAQEAFRRDFGFGAKAGGLRL